MLNNVGDLVERLNKAGGFSSPGKDRHILFHGKQALPLNAASYVQLRAYLNRRQQVVGQVLITAELLRTGLAGKIKNIEATGAFWQLYRGVTGMPACHTSPCLILMNGLLPHVLAVHPVLKQEIILNFADVMLMPDFINRVDSFVDDKIGSKEAMVEAMRMVMLEGKDYRQALTHYRKVRSNNLHEFLSGFSSLSHRSVTVYDQNARKYTQIEASVIDDDITELRLIFLEYIESDKLPLEFICFENYRKLILSKMSLPHQ